LVVGWVTEVEGPLGAGLSVCAQAAPAKLKAANTLKLRSLFMVYLPLLLLLTQE